MTFSRASEHPATEVTVDQAIDGLRKTLGDYEKTVREQVNELKKRSGTFRTLPTVAPERQKKT
jgi:hypothetical protein